MEKQSFFEEKLNALSHAIGILLGIVALGLLIMHDTSKTDWSLFSVIVYGISIIVLFTASTCYHAIKNKKVKSYFRIIDHISIYFLIAGTYTPVCLIVLEESLGWALFFTVWGISVFGVILKLFFTGKFETFSLLLYLVMGWLIVFDFSNVLDKISDSGILLLFSGGLVYTVGIIFYAISKIPYNHVIWHIFVLAGAILHFFMIYLYVI